MKITITGSLGNVSRPLVQKLVSEGHEVTVVSQRPEKVNEIESLHAKAAIGSVEDADFITEAFNDADAVYTMIPPNFSVPSYGEFAKKVRENYALAIMQASVRYVVNLSSIGSALAGKPPLTGYQNLEENINQLPGVNVVHLRPGGFYSNFFGSIPMIKHQGIIGNNFGEEVNMIMTHPEDIADAAFDALNTLSFSGVNVHYVVSNILNGKDAAILLGNAIGKEVKWISFSDEQLLQALTQIGFSKDAAQHYIVDMGIAIRDGLLQKHYSRNKSPVSGKRTFKQFAQEFAKVYATS